jgi:IS5 family transposase
MYRKHVQHPEFESFFLPFGGHLDSGNRWVRMAKLIPWTEVEQRYEKLFADSGMGAPAKNVRIALGALIIKERLGLSDEETVEQIRENPYLQYFLGYESYRSEAAFEASMMVHFRKRLGMEDLNWVQEKIAQRAQKKTEKPKDTDPPGNGGQLIVDATVAPADIKYPTDVNLLNEARKKTEAIIDTLHEPLRGEEVKVRTYRCRARQDYLRFAKKRKHTEREWRKAIGKQLRYVQRNVRHIQQLADRVQLSRLTRRQLRDLWVVQELVRQQRQMHQERTHVVAGRIVSLSQPHVRPIVRGKLAAAVEFGAKLSVSVVDGFCYVDRLSWDNYNESADLSEQIERYRARYGHYPCSVHADKLYRTRENRRYCQQRGIRLSGPALGRPRKDPTQSKAHRRQQRLDERVRVEIEGKFGVGKRKYSLGRVMAKLARTSETAIGIVFLVMGLEKAVRVLFSRLVKCLVRSGHWPIYMELAPA